MVITSAANPIVKQTIKLSGRSGRKKQGAFLLEGQRLVADAIAAGAPIRYVMLCEDVQVKLPSCNAPQYVVNRKIFENMQGTVHSQGVLAVAALPQDTVLAVEDLAQKRALLYLDNVADPGNMGTILRTADAAGVDAVVLSRGCVDVYNPKVVRATMASLFHIPLFFDDAADTALRTLQAAGFRLIGACLDGAVSCFAADFTGKTAIVIGNEANGIRKPVLERCETKVKIPMVGGAESLNAAVACGILCYERLRQNGEGI